LKELKHNVDIKNCRFDNFLWHAVYSVDSNDTNSNLSVRNNTILIAGIDG